MEKIIVNPCRNRKSLYICITKQSDLWCNGSTPVFGTVSWGSNPCGSTISADNQRFVKFTATFTANNCCKVAVFIL